MNVRREEARLQQESIVSLFRVHRDPHHFDTGSLQQGDELCLLLGREREIRIDAEDQKLLMPTAPEEASVVPGSSLRDEVEPLPRIENSQVCISIESMDELFPLVEHVRLHRVIHLVPSIRWLLADDLGSGSL